MCQHATAKNKPKIGQNLLTDMHTEKNEYVEFRHNFFTGMSGIIRVNKYAGVAFYLLTYIHLWRRSTDGQAHQGAEGRPSQFFSL